MPASLWSGNLRLSLVLIPVKLHAATTEGKVAFRMLHASSGQPIRNVKGVRDGETFTEVPDDEIVKGYEHAKGHHVLIHPSVHLRRGCASAISGHPAREIALTSYFPRTETGAA